jgi:hypothetical protein
VWKIKRFCKNAAKVVAMLWIGDIHLPEVVQVFQMKVATDTI